MDLLNRFVGIWIVCVIYIAVGVKGANFNETCTANGDCAEKNAAICDSGTKKCICSDNFFRKTAATECAAQVTLKATCSATETTPDQCSIANSECRDDSGTDKCLCETTHHETGGACVLNKDYGDQCTGSEVGNCKKATHIICDTTCKCSPTTFRKTTPAECATRIAYKAICVVAETAPDQCVADTECKDDGAGAKKCLCKTTHFDSSGVCTPRKKPSESCAVNQCVPHANCTSGTNICECWPDYTATPIISPTMCSGVYKVLALPCMYMVTVLVSMMLIVR
ncbi:uncharacterized protein LOC143045191 [Mytilus galloprovincialis]|uniref:uncharacterized protein LOC143045191 n=1 Tax=Mytilus galloprovincialis TaxID=29158 RepID=UPI003F7CA93D